MSLRIFLGLKGMQNFYAHTFAINSFEKCLLPDVVRLDIYGWLGRAFKNFIIRTLWRIYYYKLHTKKTWTYYELNTPSIWLFGCPLPFILTVISKKKTSCGGTRCAARSGFQVGQGVDPLNPWTAPSVSLLVYVAIGKM